MVPVIFSEYLASLGLVHHVPDSICVCGLDVAGVALPSLVYVFDTCTCPRWPYDHLVEHVHHRECFADGAE